MKDIMRDKLGAPKIVDRSTFQAELDVLCEPSRERAMQKATPLRPPADGPMGSASPRPDRNSWPRETSSLTALFATPRAREAAAPNPARALDRGGRRRFLFGLIEGGER
jgi:hypothetical protein